MSGDNKRTEDESQENGKRYTPSTQMSIAQKAINRYNIPPSQMSAVQKAIAAHNLIPDKMSIAQKVINRYNMPPSLMSAVQKVIAAHNLIPDKMSIAQNKMSIAQKAMNPTSLPFEQMSAAQKALSFTNSNWIFTKPVLEQMPSILSKEDYRKKVFSKIPKENYSLNKNDNLEYFIENNETKESIPVSDIADSMALTDIIDDLDIDEVFKFYDHLAKFPMLGTQHPTGKKILEQIVDVPLKTIEDIYIHRARDRDPNDPPFTEPEMYQAPHGKASNGRFNMTGHGELYTCSSEVIAFQEVEKKDEDRQYDLIKWKLTEPVEILDLAGYDSPLVQFSSKKVSSDNKKEYLIPNFLSQCVKYHQIDGIRYNSVIDENEYNLVFFDFKKNWLEPNDRKINISNIEDLREQVTTGK